MQTINFNLFDIDDVTSFTITKSREAFWVVNLKKFL